MISRRGSSGKDAPMIALLVWAVLAMPVTTTPQSPGSAGASTDDIQLRHFDDDDDDDEMQGPHFHSEEEMGGHAERGEIPETWLTKGLITRPYLLEVQALIVKDEQVTEDCKPSQVDLRKSNWRHFMCYGSILSNTFILTTTSCLHETLYIRHNIQASLAAVIAPVSESIQVIQILRYFIHPKLDVDPRHTQDHIKYDLAVAKLACKISKINFYPVDLPTKPLSETCEGGKCLVTVIKRKEDRSNIIFEYIAKDLESHKLTVRQDNFKSNDNINEAMQRLMCTKSGSAVMADKTQAGMVAMSCDVRQPETPWLYTDLFDNVEWIIGAADLETPITFSNDNTESQNGKPPEKCSTCVYNFYFDSKSKDMCPNKIINNVGGSLNTCNGNSEEPKPKEKAPNSFFAYPKDDYLRALDIMYRDQFKHNHQGLPIAPPRKILSINDQMIPVTNNFEVSQKTDTNNNAENQNVDTSKPKENENQESTKSSNKIVDKTEIKENPNVPDEYKNLYNQYLKELQLKDS